MSPQSYPAAIAGLLNTLMAVVVAFNFLPVATAHAITVAVVALTSLVVVFLVRPVTVAAAVGASQVFLVSLGAFGFHLSDEKMALVTGVVTAVLTWFLHDRVWPVVPAAKHA